MKSEQLSFVKQLLPENQLKPEELRSASKLSHITCFCSSVQFSLLVAPFQSKGKQTDGGTQSLLNLNYLRS